MNMNAGLIIIGHKETGWYWTLIPNRSDLIIKGDNRHKSAGSATRRARQVARLFDVCITAKWINGVHAKPARGGG